MNVILSCIMPLVYTLFLWKKKNNNFDVIFISNEWSFVCFSPCETWIFFYLYKPNSILVQSFSLFFLWIRSKLLYLLVFSMLVKIIVSKTWVVLYIFLFFYLNWIFFIKVPPMLLIFINLTFHDIQRYEIDKKSSSITECSVKFEGFFVVHLPSIT